MNQIKLTFPLFVFLSLFLFSCDHDNGEIIADQFYHNYRNDALDIFGENIGVIKRDQNKILVIYLPDNSSRGIAFINYDKDNFSKLELVDSLKQEQIDLIKTALKIENHDIENSLLIIVYRILNKMDDFHLRDVTHDTKHLGIHSEFNITWEDRVMYIPEISKVTNKEWLKLIRNSKKYDENWYYYNINNNN